MIPRAIAVATAVLLAGCAADPAAVPDGAARAVLYDCEGGPPLTATFAGDAVTIRAGDGEAIVLPQEPAGSGFRYRTPRHELRGKGDEAMWTIGRRVPIMCRARR